MARVATGLYSGHLFTIMKGFKPHILHIYNLILGTEYIKGSRSLAQTRNTPYEVCLKRHSNMADLL